MKNWEAMKSMSEGKCVRHYTWPHGVHITPDCKMAFGDHQVLKSFSMPEWYLANINNCWEIYEPDVVQPGVQSPASDAEAEAVLDRKLVKRVTDLIENDPHQWSKRPCATCRAVSAIVGYDFGCLTWADSRSAAKEA